MEPEPATVVRRGHRRWILPAVGAVAIVVATIVVMTQVSGSAACPGPTGQAAPRWRPVALREQPRTGSASYYSTNGNGACSFGPPSSDSYVAIGPAEFAGGAACGEYLEVTGPTGTTPVQVVDLCPSCPAGKLDLSRASFARIGPLSAGIIRVSYVVARDPQLPGPLRVKVKGGTSRSSLSVVVDRHGNPLSTVELQTPGGWVGLHRGGDNTWTGGSGAVSAPVTLRISDTGGHQAVVTGLALGQSGFQETGVLMYGGASPSPSPSPSEPSPGEPSPSSPAASTAMVAAAASCAP